MRSGNQGGAARRPRARRLRALVLLLPALAAPGCARFVDVQKTDLLKDARIGRIAIHPFTADLYVEAVAGGDGPAVVCRLEGKRFGISKVSAPATREVTAIFSQQLAIKRGFELVLPGEVAALVEARGLDPSELGPKAYFGAIAQGLGADAVVAGTVYRYNERSGSAYGAERPASIAIDVHLMDGRSGALLWEADYSEAQAPLLDNVGSVGMVVQRGAKFLTISQLAAWAVEQIVERFPEKSP